MLLIKWFDNESNKELKEGIDWLRIIPFIFIHLMCFAVIWVGVSTTAVVICFLSYIIRMFAITAFYHRYFSHKTFKTSRLMQTIFAIIGASATQRGPLWWASHHRHHHINSDKDADLHSPKNGFWYSHLQWFLMHENFNTQSDRVKDLNQFPELKFIDRYDILFPFLLAVGLYVLGEALSAFAPSLNTNGWQLVIWGYFISTVLLSHVTYCINSLAHVFGTKSYNTNDESRNNFLLALLTLGEGWHNNHHCAPGSVKQGFKWWQIDISFYGIKALEKLGLVWDLKYPNQKLLKNKIIRKLS
ncbi:MAG: acyl-CoA desaturase [Flavobacteriaceae bacterium]|nr:acyl-CoA desaturase [Flavobacteriaceae bacterium]